MATVIPQVSIQDLVFNKSTPNTVGALQAGLNLSGTFQDQQKAKRQEQALLGQQQLGQEVASGLLSGQANPQGMAQLLASNPEMAAGILKQAGIVGQQGRDQLARTAFEIESIPAGSQRDAKIQEIGAQLQSQGRDPNLALGLIGLSPEQQNKKLQSMQLAAMSPQQIQAIAQDERNFGLEQQKFGLQQANVASQIAQRQAPKAPTKTSIEKNLISAGFTPGTPEFQKEVLKFIQKPVGTTVTIGDSKTLSKATEGQLASAGFANRMANAAFDINKLEDGGFDASSLVQKIGTTLPGGNFVLSEEGQLYEAAKTDFITAILRKESGAAIGDKEREREDQKLFPQPGDGAKTVAAKRLRRGRSTDNLVKQSKGVYSIQFQTPEEVFQEAPEQTGTAAVTEASPGIPVAPPSGRAGGVLQVDAQGNRAFVFPDGTFEEVQ